MTTTTNSLQIRLPYAMRHLNEEIKRRNGQFDGTTKLWTLPDTDDNRAFAAQFQPLARKPIPPSPDERIKAVTETSVELLNALRVGQFRLVENSPRRIVIEREFAA